MQALFRLMAVQSAWTYERMLGIGIGHATAPFLPEVCATMDREERDRVVARSASFFNSHPYLAGVAVGAMVRAEQDRVPGDLILRLRTALSGPLGAVGDQLIWAGEVPLVMGLAIGATPLIGGWAVLAAVVLHNVLRVRLTWWGLTLGLAEGLKVGAAIQRSPLPHLAILAQRLAAFAVGLGVPIAAAWLLQDASTKASLTVAATVILGALLAGFPAARFRISGLRFGLLLMLITLLFVGVAP